MFNRILTVCTGNICRSPLAEALLRLQLAGVGHMQVRSAGIGALVGKPTDETVQRIAGEDALLAEALAGHRAQQIGQELTRWADLVLAMEPHHMHYVVRMDPTARGKTFLLGHWLDGAAIPDPFLQQEDVYRKAHAQIAQAVRAWRSRLG